VLDGGHILFATIEAIIRRPLPAKVMVAIYNVFTFLIIALALVITFNDVILNSWRVVGK
jgi:regulator of sigma E protease